MRTVVTENVTNDIAIIVGISDPVIDPMATKLRGELLCIPYSVVVKDNPVFFQTKEGEYLISDREARIIQELLMQLKQGEVLTDDYEVVRL